MPNKFPLLLSWNVNGIRAGQRKGFLDWLEKTKPDILGIQETKAHVEQLDDELLHPKGYETFWSSANKKGYSGTAVYVRKSPQMSITNFEQDWLDEEGRVVMLEYPNFVYFNVYFPNGGRGPERLQYKLDFYDKFLDYIEVHRKKGKNIIVCGDINTAHHEIDLARPKQNAKTSGFMPIEREWLDKLEAKGYVDTFRVHNPEKAEQYSWWDMKSRARDRNVGWRIDYFWVNKEFLPQIKEAFIWQDVMGSDHAPVGIRLNSGL
jgi:exodeoxyribonuclease III